MEENENSPENESPARTSPFLDNSAYDNKRRYLTIIGIVVAVLALLGGAVFLFTRPGEPISPSPSPLSEEPSPSPEPELKRSDLRLQILNGSGRAGVAGEARTYLEGLGYNVEEVGNASSFDFEKTEIRIKNSKSSYLGLLEEDLSEEYDLGSSKTLSEDSEFDAVVVMGGLQPSPVPSPSPSPEASPGASPSPSPSPTSPSPSP